MMDEVIVKGEGANWYSQEGMLDEALLELHVGQVPYTLTTRRYQLGQERLAM